MIGRFGQQLENPLAVAARNTAMRLTPPRLALRLSAPYRLKVSTFIASQAINRMFFKFCSPMPFQS